MRNFINVAGEVLRQIPTLPGAVIEDLKGDKLGFGHQRQKSPRFCKVRRHVDEVILRRSGHPRPIDIDTQVRASEGRQ
jgi:hypothetical protein